MLILLQNAKTEKPKLSTVDGIVTRSNCEHSINTESPILLTFRGIFIDLMPFSLTICGLVQTSLIETLVACGEV